MVSRLELRSSIGTVATRATSVCLPYPPASLARLRKGHRPLLGPNEREAQLFGWRLRTGSIPGRMPGRPITVATSAVAADMARLARCAGRAGAAATIKSGILFRWRRRGRRRRRGLLMPLQAGGSLESMRHALPPALGTSTTSMDGSAYGRVTPGTRLKEMNWSSGFLSLATQFAQKESSWLREARPEGLRFGDAEPESDEQSVEPSGTACAPFGKSPRSRVKKRSRGRLSMTPTWHRNARVGARSI